MRFTKDHQWIVLKGDIATIGVTAYAARQLGDVVYVQTPEVGLTVRAGEPLSSVEGVRTTFNLAAPIDGVVSEAHADLSDTPEQVDLDPEGSAWFARLQVAEPAQVDALMDRDAYEAFLDSL